MHLVRQAYGWTDEYIIDQIQRYGTGWFDDAIKNIMEDRQFHYKVLSRLMPLAKTPMSEKGSSAMRRYEKDVEKMLDGLTPWRKSLSMRRRNLESMGVKPGEVVVILDSGDSASNPLYKDAKISSRSK